VVLFFQIYLVNASQDSPTFTRDIAPILQKRCQDCHRPGQIGQMSLLSYEDARPWAKSIREQVASRKMPPWLGAPGVRDYTNDRSLSEKEIQTIVEWIDGGAAKGDERDLPPPREFPVGWQLGEPDAIVGMTSSHEISAQGDDEYRCYVLDPKLDQDRTVSAVEIQPGNREVDHHIVLYVDKTGRGSKRIDSSRSDSSFDCFGGVGFQASSLGGWAPGGAPRVYPDGTGQLIPAGAKIVMQMHYHPNGKPQVDQTKVGLHFASGERRPMIEGLAMNSKIDIAPGDANYTIEAERLIPSDATLYSIAPHMHLLGKSAEMWVETPDGARIDLVRVPRWDFHWQTEFILSEPLHLAKGSKLKIKSVFDNSDTNPFQPLHPPKQVTFGEQTTDEMCVGVYFYTVESDDRPAESLKSAGGN